MLQEYEERDNNNISKVLIKNGGKRKNSEDVIEDESKSTKEPSCNLMGHQKKFRAVESCNPKIKVKNKKTTVGSECSDDNLPNNNKGQEKKNKKKSGQEVAFDIEDDKNKPEKKQTKNGKFKNPKVSSSDDDVKNKPGKKQTKNEKFGKVELNASDSEQSPQKQKPDKKNVDLPREDLPNVDRNVAEVNKKKISDDKDKKNSTIPTKKYKNDFSDSSDEEEKKKDTIKKNENGRFKLKEKTDPMDVKNSKNPTIKKDQKDHVTERTDRMYPKSKNLNPPVNHPLKTAYDGTTSGSENDNPNKSPHKTQGTSSTNFFKNRELNLEVHLGEDIKGPYKFQKNHISFGNFEISRNKIDNNQSNLSLTHKSVSSSHAHVVLIKNRGFFIQNNSKTNPTRITVREKTRIILKERMDIIMCFTLFKIKTLKKDQITMEALLNYMDPNSEKSVDHKKKLLEFSIGEKLYFGSSPKIEEETNRFIFTDDKHLKETEAIFYYQAEEDQILLEPFESGMGLFDIYFIKIIYF